MDNHFIHQDKIRQILFLSLLLILAVALVYELYAFLPALLGAITLYVICRKYMFQMIYVKKWKPGAAAALLMVSTFLILLIPIWVLVKMLTSKVSYALEHANELVAAMKTLLLDVEARTGLHIMNEDTINKVGNFIANALPITPGGMGVGEAATETLFRSIGTPGGAILMVTWRASTVAICVLGAIFFLYQPLAFPRVASSEAAQ